MLQPKIFVAIGSNLTGNDGISPLQINQKAIARLACMPGLHLVAASQPYRSAPFPPPGPSEPAQPDYVNSVAYLHGNVAPQHVLNALHAIEAEFGRRRSVPNAARTLDLDLLGIDDLVIDMPDLRLPHPRLHLRRFVLMPLADVAPGWVHPLLGRTVTQMLADLPPDGTCRLDPALA